MRFLILSSLLVVAVSASLLEEDGVKFNAFKLAHGKTYKNQVEETKRFTIFRENLRLIDEHNNLYAQGLVSYKQGINQFADLTPEEFRAKLTLHQKPTFNATKYVMKGIAVPLSVDWRAQGQVTSVKNQGECGSCWAFSIAGSIEAAYYRKSKQLVSFSPQQLVDCTSKDINYGCSGGYLDSTFPYIEKNGLQSEESYPYTGKDGQCQYDFTKVVTKINDYVSISGNEQELLEAVASVGPVSVTMDASYLSHYVSGIYSEQLCATEAEDLNHAVLIVGYGTENGQNYWIVKNSWGQSWGEQGFFKIVRGSNECGIAQDDVYPMIN